MMNKMSLPDHWKVARLAELGDLVRGVTYKRQEKTDTSNPGYLPILRATNIQDRQLLLEELVYVKGEKVSDSQLLHRGDVIIAMSSGSKSVVGKSVQLNTEWEGSFGAFCAVFRHNSTVEPFFIGHIFQTKSYREHLLREARGTNINNLSKNHILDYHFPLPPLPEQREIAHVLQTIQETKLARQREIALERERKAALMDFLFSHGTKEEPRKQTEIGEIPESWEVVKLEKLCECLDSKRIPIKQSERKERKGEVPYYGASGQIDWIDDHLFDEPLLLVAEDGENLVSRKLPIAYSIEGKSWVNNHAHVLRVNNVNQFFLEYYFNSIDLLSHLTGATRPKLNKASLLDIPIPRPGHIEADEIALVLVNCDTKIAALEQETQHLDELFHAMLDELMTGQRSAVPLINTSCRLD
jgi:type I restriction enzyme S subunit